MTLTLTVDGKPSRHEGVIRASIITTAELVKVVQVEELDKRRVTTRAGFVIEFCWEKDDDV